MIVVTGAAGFIGSCLVGKLNDMGYADVVAVDDFSREDKNRNLESRSVLARVDREDFHDWLEEHHLSVGFILHMGARTDTTEKDRHIFDHLNLHYTQRLWQQCSRYHLPLIYASSAATYGLGEHGYHDRHDIVEQLTPLNPYGDSKNDFDRWALQQDQQPPYWVGLKFFNVYGPNEYHKGRMASVVFHTGKQIEATGEMKLFRSHRSDVEDGQQMRDFIYIKDVVDVTAFMLEEHVPNGLYNLGTGQARSFWDLAATTFRAMGKEPNISFIDTPEDIRDTYQYFTEADMTKLREAGYEAPFTSLEEGITDYVQQYLMERRIW